MTATRVDFYILEAADPMARLRFACRLAEKVWKLSQSVHAHAADTQGAARLDEMLWTFRAGSFLPHEQVTDDPEAPITVGQGNDFRKAELLINLQNDVPDFFSDFPRVAEIVDASDAGRAAGRERFRIYREAGLEPETHEIR